ncbi:MAG: aminodeoxychorismate synthase component I [Candidatus Saelkia tenebricola]|nr:aminodeoxychorismate synthase component I [Candidatus Saelkia tenebricola]
MNRFTLFKENSLNFMIKSCIDTAFVFLETSSTEVENKKTFLFNSFSDFITFYPQDDLNLFFKKMQTYLKSGFWLAGFFCYEFGYFLDESLSDFKPLKWDSPLAWFGVCKSPIIFNHRENIAQKIPRDYLSNYVISNLKTNISKKEYISSIADIKKYIEQGETYQVNYTFKYKFDFTGDIFNFYLDLHHSQPTPYMALINTEKEYILSLSPELFFRVGNSKIEVKPMKGTVSRGRSLLKDEEKMLWLKNDIKNRAENVMIVDLLRNDLGRVSKTGSVEVINLFEIEKYRTLHQMTSKIEGDLKNTSSFKEIIHALFPSGSVTGAPKINTMKIISRLEREARGIYTGSIGYISPDYNSCFNVAIRTVSIKDGKGEMGVGGGIVYDSDSDTEYKEANLKARFLIKKIPSFSLIESMLWNKESGYYLLDLHLDRLLDSAKFFRIPLKLECLEKRLNALGEGFLGKAYKIRVFVDLKGKIDIDYEILEDVIVPLKVKLSRIEINSDNVFLYHKSTYRDLYDQEREKVLKDGFFEVVFLNTKSELTEGAISNIFLSVKGKIYTPSAKCGLLPGVLRKHLIESGWVYEKVLYLEDMKRADTIFIGNSVRGLLEAEIKIG